MDYINSGYQHIVDIDLKGFFDEVDHCLLLQILYRKIKCRETMRLIRRWLRVPIWLDGKLVKRRKGVPQGSPLSPLLITTITVARLTRRGYESLLTHYYKVSPQHQSSPLFPIVKRTAVYETRPCAVVFVGVCIYGITIVFDLTEYALK